MIDKRKKRNDSGKNSISIRAIIKRSYDFVTSVRIKQYRIQIARFGYLLCAVVVIK